MTRYIKYIAWIGLVCCLLSVSVSHAVESKPHNNDDASLKRSPTSQAYYNQIQAVLEQKAFGEKKKVKQWRLKDQKKEEKDKENKFLKWLSNLLDGVGDGDDDRSVVQIASGVEVLLWSLLVGLMVYLLVKYRAQIKDFIGRVDGTADASPLPTTMFGLDVKKTSMPKDVVSSARAFWQAGEQRQAIALLLRASLIKLLHEHHCIFIDSDTEAECCTRIEKHVPQTMSQYMHLLVKVWQQLAYGHRVPSDNVFNILCRQWQEVF